MPLLLLIVFFSLITAAVAQPAGPTAQEARAAEPSAEELRALSDLLRRPAIQAWLQSQASRMAGESKEPATGESEAAQGTMGDTMGGGLNSTRAFLRQLAAAVPTVPTELGRARAALMTELQQRGPFAILLPLAFFAALGYGAQSLFWRTTGAFRRRMIATGLESSAERLRAAGLRILYGLGVLLSFAAGSIGAFLAFEWPPLLQRIVLAYLLVFLSVQLVLVAGRVVLAPGAERFRLVPMATRTARFWYVWSAVLVGWFCFGQFTYDLLPALRVGAPVRHLVGLLFGLILLCLALFALWLCPSFDGLGRASHRHRLGAALLSLYLIALWLSALAGATVVLYVGIILLLLPIAVRGVQLAVAHVLRPRDGEAAEETAPSLTAVSLERGLRAVLLIGGAYLIAWLLALDFGAMSARDTLSRRLLRGAIDAAVIVLVADFAWHLSRAFIDRKLAEAAGPETEGEVHRRARLRTLLPIVRNVSFVALLVMAALMSLSAFGVEIGPLIAGVGVVGVAIGFGAQTLVKDIISGMFFLLDDAFRIGEYIESGSIRGTVEGFSLRSMKLRHHRGALHTIPFGSLEKITNYSRDWVIDKLTVGVTYATDLAKVKKIVKEIGKELQADPEFAPHIIETLKMQGVEQFGDFAIQIRMKMMTKPGEQFVIRRRAYALIKDAFAKNGIEFAFPTVSVSGGGEATAAVAQKGLELVKPPVQAAT